MTYDTTGKRRRTENLAGQATTTAWDCCHKVYADGKGPKYEYDAYGQLAKRTWARGIDTFYAYGGWGNLTSTTYSDTTPAITLSYDALGRQIRAIDAAGTTIFSYDVIGSLTNEAVVGVAGTNILERFTDAFGRDAGYALNGVRQSTLGYDLATGRISSMSVPTEQSNNRTIEQFTWSYLPGSDLKSSLAYPNGLTASWSYDAAGRLLQVRNAFPTNVVSQFDYAYDVAGRRIGCTKSGSAFETPDTNSYLYNVRSELTNATAVVDSAYRYGYQFDDIGNRETSSERGTNSVYTANSLNQYTAVDDFVPQFDDDGNQMLVKTLTGVWSVTYDAENRPFTWSNGTTNIVMAYDRLCRRISKNGIRFVYKGFLQVGNSNGCGIIWDPTESGLTRPLMFVNDDGVFYYTHDGNKNVSEVIAPDGEICSHYVYSPFGAVDAIRGVENFIRFSSEYSDDEMGAVYYNFRFLNPLDGRWVVRDPGEELFSHNLYWCLHNEPVRYSDWLGLDRCRESNSDFSLNKTFDGLGGAIGSVSISYHRNIWQRNCYIKCKDCRIGYTVERDVHNGAGGGLSWSLPISGIPAGVTIPVSISYTLSGGEHYYYNSCTKEEKSQKCNRFLVSGSIGASVGVGRFISYSIYGGLSYEWTDCDGESSKFSIGITVEQCYFGQCWAVDALNKEFEGM